MPENKRRIELNSESGKQSTASWRSPWRIDSVVPEQPPQDTAPSPCAGQTSVNAGSIPSRDTILRLIHVIREV